MHIRTAFSMLVLAAIQLGPLSAAAQAQERPVVLDTVTVLGSRISSDLPLLTRSVQVWTREDIEAFPARTIADVLSWSTGVELSPRSPAQADLSLRGAGFEQVLVLVDGVRMSDPQTGHFDLDLTVPLDRVERVEILRGPASAIYGGDAVGGVVNVVTRDGGGWSGRMELGSFQARRGSLTGGVRLPGAALLSFGMERAVSDGHRAGTDWDHRLVNALLRASVGGGVLTGKVGSAKRGFGAEDFYGPYPAFETTRTTTASVAWRSPLNGPIVVEPRLRWRSHGDDFILDRADPAFYRNRHTSEQLGGEVVARAALTSRLQASAGLELARHTLESNALGERGENRWAAFGELEVRLPVDVDASVGLRYDDYQRWGGFVSPSLAVSVEPEPSIRLRASVGRSFRGPSWTERYYEDPAHVARPDLQPERSTSMEVGAEWAASGSLRIEGAHFRRTSRDLIDWARPAGNEEVWVTRNVNEARFRGVEFGATWQPDGSTSVTLGAAHLSLDSDASAGLESKYALRPIVDQVHLGIEREVALGVRAGLRGTRARRVGDASHEVLDLRLSAPVAGGTVYLDGKNLTDSDHLDITGNPVAGRALTLGVRVGG
ncbi:MAG: TonB-dependent receptor [Gemmatimonadota bacterium]